MGRYHGTEEILKLMNQVGQLRNIALVGHIDHGKTTLSDSLLAEAGLLSESLAGEARALDYLEEEQRRGITMKSANVSLYYERTRGEEKPFVINLVDTPGHLDFSGKVTRALRLVDGVVVIVDAVEEINSQSETVLKQALEEGVKPLLFINKIDRLFRELKLSNKEIEEKLNRIVVSFNSLIDRFASDDFKDAWKVSAKNGTVMFGSALHRWGFTLSKLKENDLNVELIYEKYRADNWKSLKNTLPVWETVLSMVIKHLPNPKIAQKYRIGHIWHGDLDNEVGKSMVNCDTSGPLVMCMSNIKYDRHGLIATGRIFSGTLRKGDKIYLLDADKEERALQVALYMGSRSDSIDELPAGNIAAIKGLNNIKSGETVVSLDAKDDMTSFESVKYVSEPVVTVSIEPEMLRDLDKLENSLDELLIEDPNLAYDVSNETGEVLLSGMGPLHLEVAGQMIEEKGLKVTTSKPMSVFRESISGHSEPVTVHTEDKKNHVTVEVSRNDQKLVKHLNSVNYGSFYSYQQIIDSLAENTELSGNECDGYLYSDQYGNIILFDTENVNIERFSGRKQKKNLKKQASKKKSAGTTLSINDGSIKDFRASLKSIFVSGPFVSERLGELKIEITDISLEKTELNTLTDLIPIMRNAIFKAISNTNSIILEPIYQIIIQCPPEQIGIITNLLNQHQAKISQVQQLEYVSEITAYISVRAYITFSEDLRSKTSGRAFWQTQFYDFNQVPENIKDTIIQEIRFRRGLVW